MIKFLQDLGKKTFVISGLSLVTVTSHALKHELECLRPLLGTWKGSYVSAIFDIKTPMVMRFFETKNGDIQVNIQTSIPQLSEDDLKKYNVQIVSKNEGEIEDENELGLDMVAKLELKGFEGQYEETFKYHSMDSLITVDTLTHGIRWQDQEVVTKNYEPTLEAISYRNAVFDLGASTLTIQPNDEEDGDTMIKLERDTLRFQVLKNQHLRQAQDSLTSRSLEPSSCNERNVIVESSNPFEKLLHMYDAQAFHVDCVLKKTSS